MNDPLLRCDLHDPEQGHRAVAGYLWPWAKQQLAQGNRLRIEARLLEDALTDEQRGYYHGVVLTEIAAFAKPNGTTYPMEVWKEFFRDKFLGHRVKTCTHPFTGKKSRRRVRISTEDLGVRGYAELIDKVIAFAATELGVTVSEPMPAHLRPGKRRPTAKDIADQDTGEILQGAPA